MKNTLLISLLIIGSSAVAQKTTTIDTLQELPREEAVIKQDTSIRAYPFEKLGTRPRRPTGYF